jgi:hypothetical protein
MGWSSFEVLVLDICCGGISMSLLNILFLCSYIYFKKNALSIFKEEVSLCHDDHLLSFLGGFLNL